MSFTLEPASVEALFFSSDLPPPIVSSLLRPNLDRIVEIGSVGEFFGSTTA